MRGGERFGERFCPAVIAILCPMPGVAAPKGPPIRGTLQVRACNGDRFHLQDIACLIRIFSFYFV